MSDYGTGGVEAKGWLDYWVDAGLRQLKRFYWSVLLSLRNIFRHKGRLILTLITLTVVGMVFMAVFLV